MSLKQTNDDLNEEVAELKRQIGEFQAKVCTVVWQEVEKVGMEGMLYSCLQSGKKDFQAIKKIGGETWRGAF